MTYEDIVTNYQLETEFDSASYQQEATKLLRSGKPLAGASGVLTTLIKESERIYGRLKVGVQS